MERIEIALQIFLANKEGIKIEDKILKSFEIADKILKFSMDSQSVMQNLVVNESSYIIDVICDYFKVNKNFIKDKKRSRELVTCRDFIHFWIVFFNPRLSSEKIGKEFTGKNHASITHAIQKITDLLESNDKQYKEAFAYFINIFHPDPNELDYFLKHKHYKEKRLNLKTDII
jgi:chromosomal replication initiation ATPase DnaA